MRLAASSLPNSAMLQKRRHVNKLELVSQSSTEEEKVKSGALWNRLRSLAIPSWFRSTVYFKKDLGFPKMSIILLVWFFWMADVKAAFQTRLLSRESYWNKETTKNAAMNHHLLLKQTNYWFKLAHSKTLKWKKKKPFPNVWDIATITVFFGP